MHVTFERFKGYFPDNHNERFENPSIEECKTLKGSDRVNAFEFIVSRIQYKAGKDTVSMLFSIDNTRAEKVLGQLIAKGKVTAAGKIQYFFETGQKTNSRNDFYKVIDSYESLNREEKNLFWLLLPVEKPTNTDLSKFERAIEIDSDKLSKIQASQKLLAIKGIQYGSSEYLTEYKRLLAR